MGQFKKIVYLSEAQKNELFTYGTITSNNTTITYSADDLYVTPDKSIDTIYVNGVAKNVVNGTVDLGTILTPDSGKADNSIIAPVESVTAVGQLYNQGDIFIYNDQLYRATDTIATGTNITPNTNCEVIQIIDLIEEKYTKPSTGIPASDLATGVIPDISGKADKTDTVLNTTLSMGRKANTTVGTNSTALGLDVEASSVYSHAEGWGTKATKSSTHAEGRDTTASNSYAHAEGRMSTASGQASHAEGYSTIASGNNSHAEGWGTTASGLDAHAEGVSTIASASYSHAEGANTVASAIEAHAEGSYSQANGYYSHAEGYNAYANAPASHAEGASTIANGSFSHVSGIYNVADSYDNWPEWVANTQYSIGDKVKITTTENEITTVNGYICTTANNDAEFVADNWENQNSKMNYAEIVGNGTQSNSRSNARSLDWNGNERLAGNVYVNCNADSSSGTMLPTDVQINGTSIVTNGVANIPLANSSNPGAVKINSNFGIDILNGFLYMKNANSSQIKDGTHTTNPIVPNIQHQSVFYGLAKAAGDSTQSVSDNAVGTYTTEAKAAIRTMLDVASTSDVSAKYTKPSGGIPASDLATGVIPDVSGKADKVSSATSGHFAGLDSNGNLTDSGKSASDFGTYSKPSNGIPSTDMASAVQTSLGKADTAYQKPSTGIPASDIASGVIPDVSGKIDKPSNPATGSFLVYNGTNWVAQTLSTWQGGNY